VVGDTAGAVTTRLLLPPLQIAVGVAVTDVITGSVNVFIVTGAVVVQPSALVAVTV
jgi:hypothetical protein